METRIQRSRISRGSRRVNESELTDAFDEQPSRYIVGIDLGTTNCAVAYVDTLKADGAIHVFPVQQWVDMAMSEKLNLLPSFHYQPLEA